MTLKQLIFKWIDDLVVYEYDYDILVKLLNTNDKFFVRIMTELALGNLILDDFETLIGGESFDTIVADKFETQIQVEEALNLILGANDFLNNPMEVNKEVSENFIIDVNTFVDEFENKTILEEVNEEEIYSYFKNNPESSILTRQHKAKLLDHYRDGDIDQNFLNRYINVPIVPINYNNVQLTEEDKKFALRKGIALSEVKKMKSLRYYYKAKSRGE